MTKFAVALATYSVILSSPTLFAQRFIPLVKGNYSFARGVSADGSTVVGNTYGPGPSQYEDRAMVWRAGTGIQLLAKTGRFDTATATSHDGTIFVGNAIWYGPDNSGLQIPNATSPAYFYAVTPSGNTFVGSADINPSIFVGSEAVVYSETDGLVGLGTLGENPSPSFRNESYSHGISADGTTVVGTTSSPIGNQAFIWNATSGMVGLGGNTPGVFFSHASAISSDGSTVVGNGQIQGRVEAILWTQNDGAIGLGTINSNDYGSRAHAVSAAGDIVVGTNSGPTNTGAFIWTSELGMRSLRQVLIDGGVQLGNWQLDEAVGISADGNVVVGYGRQGSSGASYGFVVVLSAQVPEPSSAFGILLGGVVCLWRRHRNPVC